MARDSVHVFQISGDAGLRNAQALAGSLRQALASHDTVSIATQTIESADITTIQLLLAARKQAQSSGKSLSLAAPPVGVLRELLVATGCLSAEGMPLAAGDDFWTPPTQSKGKAA